MLSLLPQLSTNSLSFSLSRLVVMRTDRFLFHQGSIEMFSGEKNNRFTIDLKRKRMGNRKGEHAERRLMRSFVRMHPTLFINSKIGCCTFLRSVKVNDFVSVLHTIESFLQTFRGRIETKGSVKFFFQKSLYNENRTKR